MAAKIGEWVFVCQICKLLPQQGCSYQNLSGQVEIISQASNYSDLQIIVVVVHSMRIAYSYYRDIRTGPVDPATAGPKFPVATSREPTINNKC